MVDPCCHNGGVSLGLGTSPICLGELAVNKAARAFRLGQSLTTLSMYYDVLTDRH